MNKLLSLFLFLLGSHLCAAPAEIGQNEAELLQQQTKPLGRIEAGKRVIYRWADKQVTVSEGKVTAIKLIAPEPEKTLEERAAEAPRPAARPAASRPAADPRTQAAKLNTAINNRIIELRQEQSKTSADLSRAESNGNKAQIAYHRSMIVKQNKEIDRLLSLAN